MHRARRELPDEEAVDRAKRKLAALRTGPCALDVIENPRGLRAAEVGVKHKPRALLEERLKPRLLELATALRRAPVLPDDGAMNRRPRLAIPDQRGLALVGDADADAITRRDAGRIVGATDRHEHARHDLAGLMLDPPRLRKVLREILRTLAQHTAVLTDEQHRRARRALIDRHQMSRHERLIPSSVFSLNGV